MNQIDGRLRKEGNNYYVTYKRTFRTTAIVRQEYVMECIDFAYNMTWESRGHTEIIEVEEK